MNDVRRAHVSSKGHDFGEVTERIIGAAMEVHRELGPGFMEVTYQRALAKELAARNLDFSREIDVPVIYKGEKIDTRRVDFVVEDCMLEIKARSEIRPEDFVQVLNYVKASGYKVGLLINFGAPSLQIRRLVNSSGKPGSADV